MKKLFIVCDIDGTLADLTHRLHYIIPADGGKKDWRSFNSDAEVMKDVPIGATVAVLRAFRKATDLSIVLLSGRNDVCRTGTETWLDIADIPYDALLMRANGDYRDDVVVKRELAESMSLTPENTLLVLDDRQKVVNMWREEGFVCHQVNAWEE